MTENHRVWMAMVRQRRSCRRFEDKALSGAEITLLKETCLRAPTGKNKHPWQFAFVTNKQLRQQLSHCKPHGAAFLADAPLVVVISGEDGLSDTWVEDCAIAATMLQWTAQSLGLGSCWCQVRLRQASDEVSAEESVRQTLALPAAFRVASMIGIGVPAEQHPPVDELEVLNDRIREFMP